MSQYRAASMSGCSAGVLQPEASHQLLTSKLKFCLLSSPWACQRQAPPAPSTPPFSVSPGSSMRGRNSGASCPTGRHTALRRWSSPCSRPLWRQVAIEESFDDVEHTFTQDARMLQLLIAATEKGGGYRQTWADCRPCSLLVSKQLMTVTLELGPALDRDCCTAPELQTFASRKCFPVLHAHRAARSQARTLYRAVCAVPEASSNLIAGRLARLVNSKRRGRLTAVLRTGARLTRDQTGGRPRRANVFGAGKVASSAITDG